MSTSPEASAGLLADYVTETQAAADLRCCHRTLVRRRERGDGPPYLKLHGRIFYRRGALTEWLRSRETTAPSHRGRRAS
jgi:hypothetical protein